MVIACVTGPSPKPPTRCPTCARRWSGSVSCSPPRPTANGQGARLDAEIARLIGELQADGIIVRDPERGLIDFPALAPSGATYLLCWLDGEDAIEWWHWPDAGFAGRTPISEPPE